MSKLPKLETLEEYGGEWHQYIEAIYSIFKEHFIDSKPKFHSDKFEVRINSRPIRQNKEFTFWHIISEGKVEEEREPNLRRCERIRFPKYLIENFNSDTTRSWEKEVRSSNGSRENRIHIATKDFSYIIVLSPIRKDLRTLITAFYVDKVYQRKKYEKDYEKYKLKQKREPFDGVP